MAKRHLKICSTSLVTREMQAKATMVHHFTPNRMAIIKTKTNKQTNRKWQTLASAMVWMFMSPQNSYIEILIPDEMVLGCGASGRYLGHEGGASGMWLVPLWRDPMELPHPFHPVRTQWKSTSYGPLRRPSPDHAGTLISDVQPPEL